MCMHVLSSLWCVLIRTQLVQFLKGLGKLKLSHWQPCPCQSAANRTGPKQAPLVWMINYIPRYSVSVITYPCLRYLLLAPRFSATHLAACIMHTFIFLTRLPHSQMHTISRGHGRYEVSPVNITVTSYECHGVSNHGELDCLFNSFSLFRLTSKKTLIPVLLHGFVWEMVSGSPHKGPVTSNAESVSWHDPLTSWWIYGDPNSHISNHVMNQVDFPIVEGRCQIHMLPQNQEYCPLSPWSVLIAPLGSVGFPKQDTAQEIEFWGWFVINWPFRM